MANYCVTVLLLIIQAFNSHQQALLPRLKLPKLPILVLNVTSTNFPSANIATLPAIASIASRPPNNQFSTSPNINASSLTISANSGSAINAGATSSSSTATYASSSSFYSSSTTTASTASSSASTASSATTGGDFISVYDNENKKLFKISVSNLPSNTTLQTGMAVHALTINQLNGEIFWYNHDDNTVYKQALNSNKTIVFQRELYVASMEIDPLSGNLYYVDGHSFTINVIDSSGKFFRNLTAPPTSSTVFWKIQALALDIVHKQVYWLAADEHQRSELRRMGFDGSNQTTILRTLTSARHIVFNNQKQLLYLVDEETANDLNRKDQRLYGIPQHSLKNFTKKDPGDSFVYHINFSNKSTSHFIEQFVVLDSSFLFTTSPEVSLMMINLKAALIHPNQANVMETQFGIKAPHHLSLFSESEKAFIATLQKPCKTNTCEELCLVTSSNTPKCACRTGFTLNANYCRNSSSVDMPPTYGNSCRESFGLSFTYCHPEPTNVTFNLSAPTWTDDYTNTSDLIQTFPNNTRNSYPEGRYTFTYTATDAVGNTGYCSYDVTVAKVKCPLERNLIGLHTPISTPRAPICQNGELVQILRCKKSGMWIRYGNSLNRIFINICRDNLKYEITNASQLQCESPSVTVPTTATITKTFATKRNKNASSINNNKDEKRRGRKGLRKGAVIAIVFVILFVGIAMVIFIVIKKRQTRRSAVEEQTGILTWQNEASENAYHRL